MSDKRYKPCGSESCCYTNDREYVKDLEQKLTQAKHEVFNEAIDKAAEVIRGYKSEELSEDDKHWLGDFIEDILELKKWVNKLSLNLC